MCRKILSALHAHKILFVLCFVFSLVLLFAPLPTQRVQAAPRPYMVKDINPNGDAGLWSLTAWQRKLYFQATTPHKKGLWTSDGTAQGTLHVKNLSLNLNTSFLKTGRYLYFAADDGVHGTEPWLSDGTRDGTRLVTQLTPNKRPSGINFMGHLGSVAFFSALMDRYEPYFSEFGRTDGTAGGTRALTYLNLGNGISVGNTFFFSANDHYFPDFSWELWKSDGTPRGTKKVKDIGYNGLTISAAMFGHGGLVWFLVTDDAGTYGLWRSDGTEQGTEMVKAIGTSVTYPLPFAQVPGGVFFLFRVGVNGPFELWYSDHTAEGTIKIHDINSSNIPALLAVGNTLYYAAQDGTLKWNLWKSDGTAQGTVKVADTNIMSGLVNMGNTLYFDNQDETGDMELWQSDGTPEGTHIVADINLHGSSEPQWLTRVGKTLFFSADDGKHGRELWAYKP